MVEKMEFFLLAVIARAAIASALLSCALWPFLLGLRAWRLCSYTTHGMRRCLSDFLTTIHGICAAHGFQSGLQAYLGHHVVALIFCRQVCSAQKWQLLLICNLLGLLRLDQLLCWLPIEGQEHLRHAWAALGYSCTSANTSTITQTLGIASWQEKRSPLTQLIMRRVPRTCKKPSPPGRLVCVLANWDSHGCIANLIIARREFYLWRSSPVGALRLIAVALMTLHSISSRNWTEMQILLGDQAPAFPFICIQDMQVRSAIEGRDGGLPGRASVNEAQV